MALQIESQQAVDNIADIAAVDGVDCIQMGPLDLRSDMGLLRVPDDKRPSMLLRSVIHENFAIVFLTPHCVFKRLRIVQFRIWVW